LGDRLLSAILMVIIKMNYRFIIQITQLDFFNRQNLTAAKHFLTSTKLMLRTLFLCRTSLWGKG
jgi:predicted P-loop ATPase